MMRRDTEALVRIFHPDPLLFDAGGATPTGVQKPHPGTNELIEVLIARDDDDVYAGIDALSRERSDDVVGLIAIEREYTNVEGVQELGDALHPAIEIGLQLLAKLLARGLVGGVLLVAK